MLSQLNHNCVLFYLLSERMLPLSEWGLPAPDIPLPAGLPPSERWPPSSSSSSSSRWPRSDPLCCSASEWSPWSECIVASDWFPDRSDWLSLPLCWLCCSSSLSSPNSSCQVEGKVTLADVQITILTTHCPSLSYLGTHTPQFRKTASTFVFLTKWQIINGVWPLG